MFLTFLIDYNYKSNYYNYNLMFNNMSSITGGGSPFIETPTIASNVVNQTIDSINTSLQQNNDTAINNKAELQFLASVFIINKDDKTIKINPEYKLMCNTFVQGVDN